MKTTIEIFLGLKKGLFKVSRRYTLLTIFILFSFALFAQSGEISGIIKDAATGELLPGANIYIQATGMGSVTDMEGHYRLYNIPEGEQEVTFLYIGYITQKKTVTINSDEPVNLDLFLVYDAVNLDEVQVTAQLLGQARAMNQQLNSDAMVNVVSSDKMKELPDVNAAEAIGRLPGISVQRVGGEASKIIVRGLSPKLTSVTINGVKVPATSGTDRSVDLSMIAPELLSSIEVYKSPTADMDGDAIGGIINMGVMKAPNKRVANVRVNSGYNGLDNKYGNYKGSVDLSKRFFENKLGVLVKANYESMNRSSESIKNTYYADTLDEKGYPVLTSTFEDNQRTINRLGTSLGLDYKYKTGEVVGQAFYSQRNVEVKRNNMVLMDLSQINHTPRHLESELSVFQTMLSGKQNFSFMEMDWILAASKSVSNTPYDLSSIISEYGGQDITGKVYSTQEKLDQRTFSYSNAWLMESSFDTKNTNQQNYTAALNFKIDYNITGKLSGFLKFGGKYRADIRDNSVDQYRVTQYYLDDNLNDVAVQNMLPLVTETGGVSGRKILVNNFAQGSDGIDLWGGEYSISPRIDMDYLDLFYKNNKEVYDTWPNDLFRYEAYEVKETVAAGYVMTKLNYGKWLSIIPGVRYEYSDNEYLGYLSTLDIFNLGYIEDTTANKEYGELLPSMHVKIKPLTWFDLRLSAVKTISRPDYNMITPRTRVDLSNGILYRGNPNLKYAVAWNYDAQVSFFANKLGLFSFGGFYKKFDNFFAKTDRVMGKVEATELGYPEMVYDVAEDYLNFDNSEVYGFEVDLQTNLSFLPGALKGVVLSANLTRLWSKTYLPLYNKVTYYDPVLRRTVVDIENSFHEFQETTLPDQTQWTSNFAIGYDIRGFSARISLIYQSAYLNGLSSAGELKGIEYVQKYTDSYLRLDASLSQKLGDHLQIMANFANITGESERKYQYISDYWTEENRYGMTFDIGVQYKF